MQAIDHIVNSMNTPTQANLAPPGAGLPAIELFFARILFGLRSRSASREQSEAEFARERSSIRTLVVGCSPDEASERVLIPRLQGLEDSSRFWSVWMTLDHLRIVNLEIAKVIGALVQGQIPPGEASTARVKPDPEVGSDVKDRYEASCDELIAVIASAQNLRTTARFAHPWFGPLDAAQWHAMAGMHLGIHRKQIERILQERRNKN